ncbi:hypothetical protein [Rhizobium leguminosarum]|uniref:Tyr recombinase domain-containing protein n=1 Tax=Rhizobium leguminosarum TaxID=384 RepID=A0A2K9Z389_RHILE|nr:hypothetical protein [Rhizobium leguminosarum]AUW42693.1 hypothetical protein CUJ84_Chr002337 [Rhizobium leguminosarum]
MKQPHYLRDEFEPHEIVCYWIAAERLSTKWDVFFKLLLLSGLRTDTLIGSTQADVDEGGRTLNLGRRERPKALFEPYGEKGELALSTGMVELLGRLDRKEAPHLHIFSFVSGQDRSHLYRQTRMIRMLMRAVCAERFRGRTVQRWGLSKIRRTLRFWLMRRRGLEPNDLNVKALAAALGETWPTAQDLEAWQHEILKHVGGPCDQVR